MTNQCLLLKFLASFIILATCVAYSAATEAETIFSFKTTNLPPRRQWGTNYGYCGEASTVAAM